MIHSLIEFWYFQLLWEKIKQKKETRDYYKMNLAKISTGNCLLKLSAYILFEANYLMPCSFFPSTFNFFFKIKQRNYSLQTPPCNENRVFPVKFFSQGKTCFHYRDEFAVWHKGSVWHLRLVWLGFNSSVQSWHCKMQQNLYVVKIGCDETLQRNKVTSNN